jgi:hypothetical protein
MAQTQIEKPEIKKEEPKRVEVKQVIEKPAEKPEIASPQNIEELIKSFAKPAKKFELTTLTEIPTNVSVVPPIEIKPTIQPQAQIAAPVQPQNQQVEIVQHQLTQPEPPKQQVSEPEIKEVIQPQIKQQSVLTEPIDIEKQIKSEPPKLEFKDFESKPEPEKKKPKVNIPEPEEIEDDEDDLDSIKREIMKTLSKLEQAEVE